jgi:hypothetical protein
MASLAPDESESSDYGIDPGPCQWEKRSRTDDLEDRIPYVAKCKRRSNQFAIMKAYLQDRLV